MLGLAAIPQIEYIGYRALPPTRLPRHNSQRLALCRVFGASKTYPEVWPIQRCLSKSDHPRIRFEYHHRPQFLRHTRQPPHPRAYQHLGRTSKSVWQRILPSAMSTVTGSRGVMGYSGFTESLVFLMNPTEPSNHVSI